MINIAILGYGVVGSGVYEIADKNSDGIKKRSGSLVNVKRVLDLREFNDHPRKEIFTKNYDDILNDGEISIVVETMGGVNPAYDFTKRALLAGKSVVTSNKELVATHGTELLNIAKQKDVNYMFEASVGGGIPIIRPLHECLAANEVIEIFGILNGTTNYILTKMIKEGESFENALKEAQQKGYAERNPEADVEGHDAARKICILSSLAFGKAVDVNKVYAEGITKISLDDVAAASNFGYVIKLIGYTRRIGEKVICRVSPMLVPESSPLSGVDDVFNAIMVRGDAIGDVMFYGPGAGKLPTASAVMGDVIDIVREGKNKNYVWSESDSDYVLDKGEAKVKLFVRTKTPCRKIVTETFESAVFTDKCDCCFITGEEKEKDLLKKLEENKIEVISCIRTMA